MIKVFFDTNILKFSATELRRLVPKEVEPIQWGDILIDSPVYDIVTINPNENIKNEKLRKEADLLPHISDLAKNDRIKLVTHHETLLESWGIPNMDSLSGKFYNAPYDLIEAPIGYSRAIIGYGIDADKEQLNFISSIKDKRFIEIQKATGAYQGKGKYSRNQLLDAWHIWCAEHNQCNYFLSMDFKLIRMISNNKRWESTLKIAPPSVVINEIKT